MTERKIKKRQASSVRRASPPSQRMTEGSLAMQIEDIKNTELIQSERDVLKGDTERWKLMGSGSHLDDWLAYQPGLQIRRRLAMKMNHVNRPEGRGYARDFGALMKSDGLDHMDGTSISALLWLGDDAERMQILRELRDAMNPGRRSRLNSPITARKLVDKVIKARNGGTEEKVKDSPVALLKARITEYEKEIADLTKRLEKKENGSLLDRVSENDSAADIAIAIRGTFSTGKAKAIAAAIMGEVRS